MKLCKSPMLPEECLPSLIERDLMDMCKCPPGFTDSEN